MDLICFACTRNIVVALLSFIPSYTNLTIASDIFRMLQKLTKSIFDNCCYRELNFNFKAKIRTNYCHSYKQFAEKEVFLKLVKKKVTKNSISTLKITLTFR